MCIYTHAGSLYTLYKRNRGRRRRRRPCCRTRAGEVFLLTPRRACVCSGVRRAHKLCETRCRPVTSGFMEITPRPHISSSYAYIVPSMYVYTYEPHYLSYRVSVHIHRSLSEYNMYMISLAYRPAPIILLLLLLYVRRVFYSGNVVVVVVVVVQRVGGGHHPHTIAQRLFIRTYIYII